MSEKTGADERVEVRRIARMLNRTAELAEHSKLTGAAEVGGDFTVQEYNTTLAWLQARGVVPDGFFSPLPPGASWGAILAGSRQLAAYIEEDAEEQEAGEEHPGKGVFFAPHINIRGDIPNIAELIREAIPKSLFGRASKMKADETAEEDEEPAGEDTDFETTLNEVESRIAELGGQMQVLADPLRRDHLTPHDIRELAEELRSLGELQATLAREHARVRP